MQTNLKLALQAHSDTLRDIRGFWRELCSKKTTFSSLSEVSVPLQCSQVLDPGTICFMFQMVLLELQAFTQMHLSQTRSEEIYRIVTQKYPKSVKILRAYVRYSVFLATWLPAGFFLPFSSLLFCPAFLLFLLPLLLLHAYAFKFLFSSISWLNTWLPTVSPSTLGHLPSESVKSLVLSSF